MRTAFLSALSAAAAMAMFASPAFASTSNHTSYVETQHGWVDYHVAPRLHSAIVGRLKLGEQAKLVTQANSWWYEVVIHGRDVYITTNSAFTKVVKTSDTPSRSTSNSGSNTPTPAPTPPVTVPTWQVEANKVIATAKTQLGVPYWWGHQVPGVGFDCSNFTAWSFRTGIGMSFSGASETQRFSVGTPVPLTDIRAGDLLFFRTKHNSTGGGHVGIYEGNGMVIQEGGGWGKVTEESLAQTWMGSALVYARRVIPG